ncbi:MAG: DUF2254 family protein [Chthoniobacter sp.]|uniref:DUF2254 family protein n=1 Tax=Chthoniobacter sp. TaxID=2510640 RepID=UPI0032A1F6E4
MPERNWQALPVNGNGYIQSVDSATLLRLAREHKTIVRIERGIGKSPHDRERFENRLANVREAISSKLGLSERNLQRLKLPTLAATESRACLRFALAFHRIPISFTTIVIIDVPLERPA